MGVVINGIKDLVGQMVQTTTLTRLLRTLLIIDKQILFCDELHFSVMEVA